MSETAARTWAQIVCPRQNVQPMMMSDSDESEETVRPAPLRAAKNSKPKLCYSYGRVSCQHGEQCKFKHIEDSLLREGLELVRKERHKANRERRLEAKREFEAQRAREALERRLLAAPVFVPRANPTLVPDPHTPVEWA